DLRDERFDVVADAALAELPEARQIPADLRRVHVRVVGELLRGNRLLAHLPGLREHLEIARKARRDAEGEAFARRLPAVALDVLLDRHRCSIAHRRDSSRSRSSPSSTKYSNSSSPSSATTGMRSRYA